MLANVADHESLGESSVFMTKRAITGMSNHYTSIVEKLDLESFVDNQDIFVILFYALHFCLTEHESIFQI